MRIYKLAIPLLGLSLLTAAAVAAGLYLSACTAQPAGAALATRADRHAVEDFFTVHRNPSRAIAGNHRAVEGIGLDLHGFTCCCAAL